LILDSGEGATDTAVAAKNRTTSRTVGVWRRRFLEKGFSGLYDEPRVGAPRKITDEKVEQVIVDTLEKKPEAKTHWSTRGMAKKAGISAASVGRIWRAFGLKPHIVKNFKFSNDSQLVEKVRDVVGLYMNPPDNAVVFAYDEKSQVQALERAQPILPMDLGKPECQTGNYIRHGTLDLFAALNVQTGEVLARCKNQHRAKDFVDFLKVMDQEVEPSLEVHVILDNLSAHKAPEVKRWLARHPRFTLHFTPTYASWMNLVERFFSSLTEEALRRGSHTSIPQLRSAILDYVKMHNRDPRPFQWRKSADQILESIQRAAERTLAVHT
jgi:transposase